MATKIVLGVVGLCLILYTIKNAEDPTRLAFKWVVTLPVVVFMMNSVKLFGPVGPFVIVGCAVILSYLWTPHLGSLASKPLTSIFDGGDLPPELRPAYSSAISKKKKGQYTEAVADIRRQLDRFPEDVEGHLLLAEILAEHMNDVEGAAITIHRLVAQPGHAPKNIAFALYSLADWQRRFRRDREATREALQKIIDLLPDSEYALGAAQRIAHLGDDEPFWKGEDRKKFAVPAGVKNLGLLQARSEAMPLEADPERLAAQYVKKLEEHPLDMEAREKLAIIYARHYQRLDLATAELEQMISEPHQPPKLVVHWLNLLADLQIHSGADYETVSQTLQRIIDRFPNLAAAELARNRLGILNLELKAKEKRDVVKLGTYEQNLGLKRNLP